MLRVKIQTHKHTPYTVCVLVTRDPSTFNCLKREREKKFKITCPESPPEKAILIQGKYNINFKPN